MGDAESSFQDRRAPRIPATSGPHQGIPPRGSRRERRELWRRLAIERRARAEFENLPGIRLTLCQAARLFGLPEEASRRVLELLIQEGLVTVDRDGRYVNRRCYERSTGP